jgi:hypothetical protein
MSILLFVFSLPCIVSFRLSYFPSAHFFLLSPNCCPPMTSSAPNLRCSSCKRPWQQSLYKTCEACRQKGHRHWRRHRPLATADTPSPPSTQSVLPYTDLPSSSPRTFCSQCCRPWQSARYKTCDNCRQKALAHKSRGRVLPTTENQGVSIEPVDNVRGGFPGRILPASTATRRLAPLLRHHAKRQKIIDAQPRNVDDSLGKALGFLRNEHERHATASKCFPRRYRPLTYGGPFPDTRKPLQPPPKDRCVALAVRLFLKLKFPR